jgi:hypothetical protein
MRRYLIIILCAWSLSTAAASFSLPQLSGHPGDTVTVEATLSGVTNVAALQMTLNLGEHLEYVAGSAVLSASQTAHQLAARSNNGRLFVNIFNFTGAAMSPTSEPLFTFRLVLGVEPATYTLQPEVLLSDAAGSGISVSVSAGSITLLSPKMEIQNRQIDYGHIPIRSAYTQTLTVRNTGNEPLIIDSLRFSAVEFSAALPTAPIAVGQSTDITLNYAPVNRGAISEKLVVYSNAVNGMYNVVRNVSLVADPFSVNELHMGSASGISDDTVTVSVRVNNMEPLVGAQFSLTLPQELEFIQGSVVTCARAASHTATGVMRGDTLKLMVYSASNATFSDNDGDLLTFRLRLNGISGSYQLCPFDVWLSNISLEDMTSATEESWVSIQSPRASCASTLTFPKSPITQVATKDFKIRNTGNAPLTIERLSFLQDGGFSTTTSFPVVIAQNEEFEFPVEYAPSVQGVDSDRMLIYTNDPLNRLISVPVSIVIYEPNEISLSGEVTSEGYLLHVNLDNYSDIVAFQMDINWLKNMSPELRSSARLTGLQTVLTNVNDSVCRVASYSFTNTAVAGHSGELFSILYRNTNVPSYNHSFIVSDNIFLSDLANRQCLSSKNHTLNVNLQFQLTTSIEHGTILVADSTPEVPSHPGPQATPLPDVPFVFDFSAADYDAVTAQIPNHPNAALADYQLQLSGNMPVFRDSCLSVNELCQGYINKWPKEDDASGDYFARSGNDNMTIICKVAPRLDTGNSSDFIANRGGGYNYMFRVGDSNHWFLHTSDGYQDSRAVPFTSAAPQTLVCRVDGVNDRILLENMTTGESNLVEGVHWGGTGTAFKIFYNDGGEYFRGDFYWVYYSFNRLSDGEVQQVIDYHNGTMTGGDEPSSSQDSTMYDYGATLHLLAVPDTGYLFSRWSDGVTANPRILTLTQDTTLTAILESQQFIITFLNEDSTLLLRDTLDLGAIPEFHGATPVKQSTTQYTYSFKGWSPEIIAVTGDATYIATYDSVVNQYVVSFVNFDSTLLQLDTLVYGTMPEYRGTPPTKENTAQYSYSFAGWSPQITAVTGDITYTAVIDSVVNTYVVMFLNEDSTLLQIDTLQYGALPEYRATTPIKQATAQYTYTFNGWSNAIISVTGNATYLATYTSTTNKYVITFQDEDGTQLQQDSVEYGALPAYRGETPAKQSTAEHTYYFGGWNPTVVTVTQSATYTATYTTTSNKYVVIFADVDGTQLQVDSLYYGSTPIFRGTPPTKENTAQYSYSFAGWTPQITVVTGDITYTAVIDSVVNKYVVMFLNEDSTLLQLDTLAYGALPEFRGATPTKQATAQYTYTFAGWNTAVVSVEGNATYLATYASTINKYLIVYQDEDGTLLQRDTLEYGTLPVYRGTTPSKTATAQHTYSFAGWSPSVVNVIADAIYTATYDSVVNTYVVMFLNEDSTLLQLDTLAYGALPEYRGITPTKQATAQYTYTFNGWDNAIVSVTGDATYLATYTSTVNKYVVIFQNEEGTQLQVDSLYYGSTPVFRGTPPTKENTAQYSYSFAGWSPQITAVIGDITYTAVIDSVVNTYVVMFLNEDSTLLQIDTLQYGALPEFRGTTPTKQATAQYSYTFAGWSTAIVSVEGNATYVATYTSSINKYVITFLDFDNTILEANEWEYGAIPTCAEPTREPDEQYTYTFKEWNPAVVAVVAEATYIATYEATPKQSAIEDVQEDKHQPVKIIEDGHFYILLPDGTKYSATGKKE